MYVAVPIVASPTAFITLAAKTLPTVISAPVIMADVPAPNIPQRAPIIAPSSTPLANPSKNDFPAFTDAAPFIIPDIADPTRADVATDCVTAAAVAPSTAGQTIATAAVTTSTPMPIASFPSLVSYHGVSAYRLHRVCPDASNFSLHSLYRSYASSRIFFRVPSRSYSSTS